MAAYYDVLVRALASLELPSEHSRKAVYARARSALLDQLTQINPPLPKSEIARQNTELEVAIRNAEELYARGIADISEVRTSLSDRSRARDPLSHIASTLPGSTKEEKAGSGYKNIYFDVAISFAGAERKLAERLSILVRDAGFNVFYDDFYAEVLWGKNLADEFDEIFRKRARFCVIFISEEYKKRIWTDRERQSAQARAILEKNKEYILPIKVDETELDGLPPTIGYLPISRGVDHIAEILITKLARTE